MFGLTVVTEPASEPLELSEVLEHLRYPHTSENIYIGKVLIPAARKYVEKATGHALITQTVRLTRDYFPGWSEGYMFRLPKPPLQSLTPTVGDPDLGITYTDAAGVVQTVDPATYAVDPSSMPGRIALADGELWPTDAIEQIASVKVRYVAGYGLAKDVPETFKVAMLQLIGHWFVNREAVLTGTISKDIEFGLTALLESEWCGSLAGTYG